MALSGVPTRSVRALTVAALLLAACGGSNSPSASPYGAAPAETAAYRAPTASAAAAPAASGAAAGGGMGDDYGYGGGGYGDYGAGGYGTATATAAPIVVTANLTIVDNAKLGKILAASNGMTLYTFKLDSPNTTTCLDQCAKDWPPLVLASGTPVAPAGVRGTFGLITRPDGSKQVTFNSSPLHFFAGDQKQGDANGEGSSGVWFTVKIQ